MHGRHIALFPLPGKAHVMGLLGLCRELVRRGHRVTVATVEPFAALVISAGAEPAIFEVDNPLMPTAGAAIGGLPISDPKRWEEVATIASRWLLNNAAIAVWQLDEFYKQNRPDLVIYELSAYAGRVIAKRFQSPAIQYYPDFVQHNDYVCWHGSVGRSPQSIESFSRLLDSFMWAFGFEETNNFWHAEDLNLCQFPRELQFHSDSLNTDRFCFVGPFLDRPFTPMWKNQCGGKRVILVSASAQSTDANYYNRIADALSCSDYHVILSVGEHVSIGELRTFPSNFEINRFASHLEILPHTDLHLYSAGPTSTLEGFYFGVRLVAMPSIEHNYILANRLSELGVAINLPLQEVTSNTIRETVEKALQDDKLYDRVEQMQRIVRNLGGSEMAVDKIEEYLASRAN